MKKKFIALLISGALLTGVGATNISADVAETATEKQVKEIFVMLKEKIAWNDNFTLIKDLDLYFKGLKKDLGKNVLNKTYPKAIEYNGEVYVPLKILPELTGEKLEYDEAKHSIYLGRKPEFKYVRDVLKVEAYSLYGIYFNSDATMVAGKSVSAHINFDGGSQNEYAKYKLGKSYTELTGYLGLSDNTIAESYEVEFKCDDKVVDIIKVTKGKDLVPFSINITGVDRITITKIGEASGDLSDSIVLSEFMIK